MCPILTFFSADGLVGKTFLLYHIAWMFADCGMRVVCVDSDPQAYLTAVFLNEDRIVAIWNANVEGNTLSRCLDNVLTGGDITRPRLFQLGEGFFLIPGDIGLARFGDPLAQSWLSTSCVSNYQSLYLQSALWQVLRKAEEESQADIILVDIGPNLDAISRSALIASDAVLTILGDVSHHSTACAILGQP